MRHDSRTTVATRRAACWVVATVFLTLLTGCSGPEDTSGAPDETDRGAPDGAAAGDAQVPPVEAADGQEPHAEPAAGSDGAGAAAPGETDIPAGPAEAGDTALPAATVDETEAEDAPTYLWWEGEDFTETNVPDPDRQVPAGITEQERDRLSGREWFAPRGPEGEGPYFATYEVEVPAGASYNFWVRKFWKHGPFRWRFDEGEWRTCGRDIALHDDTYLRKFWGANWVFLGSVELSEGSHTLRIEMLEPGGGGAIDCFVLIDGPFVPRGTLRPDEKSGESRPGFFAWEPDADPLSDDCPIDLRYLNESEAGVDGFVRREGNGFALGGGEPVRFWMVQGGALKSMAPQMQDYWARRLAKYGVNLVRLGMLSMFNQWKDGNTEQFERELDQVHRLVAALKKEGIYVYLGHLHWDTSLRVGERHGFEGLGDGQSAFGMIFVDPRMKELYLRFATDLLTTRNPYTGLSLARDPAVAFVEITNESSLLFWTFKPGNMIPQTRRTLEKLFAQWAIRKYGSLEQAFEAWGPERYPVQFDTETGADHPDEGRLGLYSIGVLTVQDWAAGQRNHARAGDQLQFMFEQMRDFYRETVETFRSELGIGGLVTCSNWKTADPRNLGVLERFSYTVGDAVCRNVYFDVRYDPRPERFYAVDVGDTYEEFSALKPPAVPEPLTVPHVMDHPDMYTENNWCRPNRYRVEWPFLVATYASMAGMDGWNFFSLDTPLWNTGMNVWEVNSPSVLGQFPAAALMFRRGDVQEAPAAVTEHLSLEGLYDFQGAAMFELTGRDALWTSRIGDLEASADREAMKADPLAFFVGKVNRVITEEGEHRIESVDLRPYIDHENRTVRSLTGELQWDLANGIVTVNTPHAQGACGFLDQTGPIELGDVVVEVGNDYAAVLAVSLDGEPLTRSERILIQTGTEDWPYGFEVEQVDGKKRIAALGGYPTNVRRVEASVILPVGPDAEAVVLDANGYPTDRRATLTEVEGGMRLELPEDALYTLIRTGR